MKATNFSFRLDKDLKKQVETIYGELGINLTTAINVFLRKSVSVSGFPFDVRLEEPNKETYLALLDANKISNNSNLKKYDVEDALKHLKK